MLIHNKLRGGKISQPFLLRGSACFILVCNLKTNDLQVRLPQRREARLFQTLLG
jgi:hypothetical protein